MPQKIRYQSLSASYTDKAVYRINEAFSNSIDIKIVTDGEHHVLDYLHQSFLNTFEHVVSEPSERRC